MKFLLSPVGTAERVPIFLQPSLRDSEHFLRPVPSTEVLGYYQSPLTGLTTDHYSSNFLNSSAAFVPPKPKLLESA
jgi:hypothetical protein